MDGVETEERPAGPAGALPRRRYRIEDEPRPGALARFAVQPLWALLAVMFAGSWLAWPWFAWNGWVVGSPSLRREIAWVVAGFAGRAALIVVLLAADASGRLPAAAVPYALLPLTLWTLAVSYVLHILQSRGFQLYEHYGGKLRSGLPVVLGGFLVRHLLLQSAGSGLLAMLLG
jgi:hypothetical protein